MQWLGLGSPGSGQEKEAGCCENSKSFGSHKMWVTSRVGYALLASQEALCTMESASSASSFNNHYNFKRCGHDTNFAQNL
jgi:hypothetical protein